jgi:hypothetical protein
MVGTPQSLSNLLMIINLHHNSGDVLPASLLNQLNVNPHSQQEVTMLEATYNTLRTRRGFQARRQHTVQDQELMLRTHFTADQPPDFGAHATHTQDYAATPLEQVVPLIDGNVLIALPKHAADTAVRDYFEQKRVLSKDDDDAMVKRARELAMSRRPSSSLHRRSTWRGYQAPKEL